MLRLETNYWHFLIIFYIIGGILSYFRMKGSIIYFQEKFLSRDEILKSRPKLNDFFFFSWLGFIAGTIVYFENKEKYFFKIRHNKILSPEEQKALNRDKRIKEVLKRKYF